MKRLLEEIFTPSYPNLPGQNNLANMLELLLEHLQQPL